MTKENSQDKPVGRNTLQDFFLNTVRKEKLLITIYLSNGVPIKGRVISFDHFTIVLENEGKQSMIYKHAVTTITPEKPVRLHNPEGDEN
ncbi:MAG: RNA chaperone Hfq [Leptospiraceae bacterium]|nr:RNA chaperone Hfq [Leptospiraceae bacterium]MDW8305858.1 RNA chaperone Hfq [Leptospiraceae bacterium]